MAGAAQYGQEPGRYGSEDRNMLRVIAQKFFCVFEHNGQTAGCLQKAGTGNDSHNGEHDIDRGFAGFIAENKCIDNEPDAADSSQTDAAMPYAHDQAYHENKKT